MNYWMITRAQGETQRRGRQFARSRVRFEPHDDVDHRPVTRTRQIII